MLPASGQIVINEIHYDPDVKTEAVEFIELYNRGAGAVNLSGWQLTDAVGFTLPNGTLLGAGAYLVIAANPTALQAKFGVAALGPWVGTLANEGEKIVVRNAAGGVETGGFMRDCRTKGETPLHRAAAFGSEEIIQLLLEAGTRLDAKDMNGDSPLTWASWHLRPASILRKLCYGDFRVRPDYAGMEANLLGKPHV